MVERKFLRNYCIRLMFCIAIVLLFVMCSHEEKHTKTYEEEMFDTISFHKPFVGMNILFKDSVYTVVIDEGAIRWLPKVISNKKYRREIYPILKNDTLKIDSASFSKIKNEGVLVIPQLHVDTIYSGRIDNLLSFFNKKGVFIGHLSNVEQAYVIYLLFQCGIYVGIDCETGLLHIVN